jgi:hypothetical protein
MTKSKLYIDLVTISLDVSDANSQTKIKVWLGQQKKSLTYIPFPDETGKYSICSRIVIKGGDGEDLNLTIKAAPKANQALPFVSIGWNPSAVTPSIWKQVLKVLENILPCTFSYLMEHGLVTYTQVRHDIIFNCPIQKLIVHAKPTSQSCLTNTKTNHKIQARPMSYFDKNGLPTAIQYEIRQPKDHSQFSKIILTPEVGGTLISLTNGMKLNMQVGELMNIENMLPDIYLHDFSTVVGSDDYRFTLLLNSIRLRGQKEALTELPVKLQQQYRAKLKAGRRCRFDMGERWNRKWLRTLNQSLLLHS